MLCTYLVNFEIIAVRGAGGVDDVGLCGTHKIHLIVQINRERRLCRISESAKITGEVVHVCLYSLDFQKCYNLIHNHIHIKRLRFLKARSLSDYWTDKHVRFVKTYTHK